MMEPGPTRKQIARQAVLFTSLALFASASGCQKTETAPAGPKAFTSADSAGNAVYDAAKAGDSNAMLVIFGPDAKDLIVSGDEVQDRQGMRGFAEGYEQMHRWGKLVDGGVVLNIGAENYPFPFPLMKNNAGQWSFDSNGAKVEILARRIGSNELAALDVLNAIVDAQSEYFSQLHDGGKVSQYAQKIVSDSGKQNGLYWKAGDNQPESPLGPLAASAASEGYSGQQLPQPFHGYIYRILLRQGANASGGAKDYVVNGNMTSGFAVLAYPARYGASGVMSFMVNYEGVVYEKNLGRETKALAAELTTFNPDSSWVRQ